MRLYLDEMISPAVAAALRDRGHDAVTAGERGALGASDAAQLARAIQEERAIVSYNIPDFAVLARAAASAGRDHWGIILVSARTFPPAGLGDLIRALDALLTDREAPDALKNQTLFLQRRP